MDRNLLYVYNSFHLQNKKNDTVVFDGSPLVGANTPEEYWVNLPPYRRDAVVTEIGRSSSTGTGDVDQGYQNPDKGDVILVARLTVYKSDF